jgi:chemotaxis protein MotB
MSDHEDNISHGEPWLVSYADMMTLLFGFFVVMYTFAMAKIEDDQDALIRVRREIARFFGGEFVQPYEKPIEEFSMAIGGTVLAQNIDTRLSPEGVEVIFKSSALFASGSAELHSSVEPLIWKLAELLRAGGLKSHIVVEGHTDDTPISSETAKLRYPSNWELGAARSSKIIRIFESVGFERNSLVALTFADTKPLAPNRDEQGQAIADNQAMNRRIVIKATVADDAIIEKRESIPAQSLPGVN